MSDRGQGASRRRFLQMLLATPFALAAGTRFPWPAELGAATAPKPAATPVQQLDSSGSGFSPTPECGDDDEPTPTETAGPFFKPRSPLRASLLEPGLAGTKIVLTGRVFSRECRPISGALLDFWHAGDDGEYDNVGFRLRGHQFTDEAGRYRLETVVPGLYPGRTRHFHVRVQARGSRVLTTQLYFPDEPRNRRDFLFRPELLLTVKDAQRTKAGRFHFMLDLA